VQTFSRVPDGQVFVILTASEASLDEKLP
jgi:hypothetical protein